MKIALILCFVQYLAFLAEATNTFDFNPALFHSAANGREVSPVVNRDDQVDFPGETESSEEVDDKAEHLMSLAGRNPDLAMFAAGVSRSKELAEMLADEDAGPFTIFAPNNRAFAKINRNDVLEVYDDPEALSILLSRHVLTLSRGEVLSQDFPFGPSLWPTMAEEYVTVEVDEDSHNVTITSRFREDVNVTKADLRAENGVIHIVDGVL